MTNQYVSNRTPTTVAGSVQKRKTLVISATDPRNTPFYIANYVGEVTVLSEEKYREYLSKQNFIVNYSGVEDPSNEVEVNYLHPPTNLYWDIISKSDTEYITSGSAPLINVTISFDKTISDIDLNSTIEYEAEPLISNHQVISAIAATGGASTTNAAATKTITSTTVNAKVIQSTIQTRQKLSSLIQLTWKPVPQAIGYEVTVTGINQKEANGKKTKLWHTNAEISTTNGLHYFNLTPEVGKSLSGIYSFKIAVKYSNSQSGTVTYNVNF